MCARQGSFQKIKLLPGSELPLLLDQTSPHPRIHPQKQRQRFLKLLLPSHTPGSWTHPHLRGKNRKPPSHRSHLNQPFPLKKKPTSWGVPKHQNFPFFFCTKSPAWQRGGAAMGWGRISSSPGRLGKLREHFLEKALDSLRGLCLWCGECVESEAQQSSPCPHSELLGHLFPQILTLDGWAGLEGCEGLVGKKSIRSSQVFLFSPPGSGRLKFAVGFFFFFTRMGNTGMVGSLCCSVTPFIILLGRGFPPNPIKKLGFPIRKLFKFFHDLCSTMT